ncbi:hypothetical protein [Nocardia caishijiensis]|uniref:hypothetical protein n=1 Tax=Nocardia caishijiensis TaxID=184756 RepID=UPI001428B9D2|nr:hypothetical protein [Nocardia caishijiensis]
MTTPIQTPEEAQQYITRALGLTCGLRIIPFEYGWIATVIVPEPEDPLDTPTGTPRFVLNSSTGVIISCPSFPIRSVIDKYVEAMTTGSPLPGAQLYPPRTRIHMELTSNEIMHVRYLIRPQPLPEGKTPAAGYLLTIDKLELDYNPTSYLDTQAAHWILEQRTRTGDWPTTGTLEV